VLGINGSEFLLLIVVALVVVGPERLPRYAEQLGVWVRTARSFALTARSRVTEELGEDVADVDWAALDPRRYDPRRIVREALLDDSPPSPSPRPRPTSSGPGASAARSPTPERREPTDGGVVPDAPPTATGEPETTPFDDEAT
jgi:sec-independent protein translocase protein TatB